MMDTTWIPGASSMTTSLSTAPGVTVLTVAGRTLRALTFMAVCSGNRDLAQDSTARHPSAGLYISDAVGYNRRTLAAGRARAPAQGYYSERLGVIHVFAD